MPRHIFVRWSLLFDAPVVAQVGAPGVAHFVLTEARIIKSSLYISFGPDCRRGEGSVHCGLGPSENISVRNQLFLSEFENFCI